MENRTRVIAMYLPQYHPIPENDEWWGPGFTEWTNVAMAKPLFKGHNQPRVPADLGFYDLRLPETREKQADLARDAGIEGFMYWHYWFGNGRRLLERPFNEVLESGKPDFPFCLGWANHSWSRKTWTAKNNMGKSSLLIEQEYPGVEDFVQHFYSVLPAFKDPRYITVDNKPFFLIFDCINFPNIQLFIKTWQDLAISNGLKGIHFVGNANGYIAESKIQDIISCGVNAVVFTNAAKAQERCAKGKFRLLLKKIFRKYLNTGPECYEYSEIIRNIHSNYEKKENIYPCIFPEVDRTPRSGKSALIYRNSSPELFEEFVRTTKNNISHKEHEHRLILINAWNEWGEGKYLEPDISNGHAYLEALKRGLR